MVLSFVVYPANYNFDSLLFVQLLNGFGPLESQGGARVLYGVSQNLAWQ